MTLKLMSLVAALSLSSAVSFSQTKRSCQEIYGLINFSEIIKNFHFIEGIDTLKLIDKGKIISGNCSVINWGKRTLQIVRDSALERKAIRGSSAAFFGGQCQYFVIDNFKRKGKKFTFTLYQACSNEFIDCKVSKSKGKYKLIWFSDGVY